MKRFQKGLKDVRDANLTFLTRDKSLRTDVIVFVSPGLCMIDIHREAENFH